MARFAPEPAPVLIRMPGRFAMDYAENSPGSLGKDCRPVALPANRQNFFFPPGYKTQRLLRLCIGIRG